MSRNGRLGLLAAAVVIVIVAFVALRPDDAKTPTPGAGVITSAGAAAAPTPSTVTTAAPAASSPVLQAGSLETITVRKDDTVRLRARSAKDDEVHVHGYDLMKDAPAGRTVSLSFKASVEGIFEVEFEDADEQIAKLVVEP